MVCNTIGHSYENRMMLDLIWMLSGLKCRFRV